MKDDPLGSEPKTQFILPRSSFILCGVAAHRVTHSAIPPPDLVKTVGIGTRVRMVFSDAGPGLSLPQWAIDGSAAQPDKPWRYPEG